MSSTDKKIYLFTDGACSGNPGPGGYGVILRCGDHEKEMSGGFADTTNNRMELLAVIVGLEAIKIDNAEVEVWSDSSYVVNAITKGWLENWVKTDFAKKANPDLWKRFLPVYRKHRVTFHWLKGHAGHPENERCDALAVAAYQKFVAGGTCDAAAKGCPFDEYIDRHGTYSIKYDKLKELFGRDDLTSLWIADMDFKSPQCVHDAICDYLSTGSYGYSVEPCELFEAVRDWLGKEHGWKIDHDWFCFIPGIVRGIAYAVNFFTEKGDKIVVQSPVYYPFTNVPEGNGRVVLRNPLKGNEMDFDNLEKLLTENDPVKMLILCNPHNPGGFIWTKEQLAKLAHICKKHNVIVISDEIHSDLYLWGNGHIPFATVSEEAASCSITFGAPSKTFNIPGFATSYCLVPNETLRVPFYKWLTANEFNVPTIIPSLAAITAYRNCKGWRDSALRYIESNIIYLEEKFAAFKDPDGVQWIKPVRPEASFLVWLDCRHLLAHLAGKAEDKLTLKDQPLLVDYFVNTLRLALNDGTMFGPEGVGYMRMNVACPRKLLEFPLK